jgi:hypothetical protein
LFIGLIDQYIPGLDDDLKQPAVLVKAIVLVFESISDSEGNEYVLIRADPDARPEAPRLFFESLQQTGDLASEYTYEPVLEAQLMIAGLNRGAADRDACRDQKETQVALHAVDHPFR